MDLLGSQGEPSSVEFVLIEECVVSGRCETQTHYYSPVTQRSAALYLAVSTVCEFPSTQTSTCSMLTDWCDVLVSETLLEGLVNV